MIKEEFQSLINWEFESYSYVEKSNIKVTKMYPSGTRLVEFKGYILIRISKFQSHINGIKPSIKDQLKRVNAKLYSSMFWRSLLDIRTVFPSFTGNIKMSFKLNNNEKGLFILK